MSEPATTPDNAPAAPPPFTEDEWRGFRRSDRGVTAVIVALLAGLFLMGLALYAYVALEI